VALGGVAEQARQIALGVGVIPLSSHPAEEIVREVLHHDLSPKRLYLGIGSGAGSGGVERVAKGLREIKPHLECRLVVAALGPKMCRLAGTAADGVLFNWVTPDFARRSIEWVRDGAKSAGRPMPRLMAYVRAALGDGAMKRLEREAANYESVPHYASHFKRMGVSALETAVTGSTPEDIQEGLHRWDGVVDEVVVRGITADDTVEDVLQLVQAARPEGFLVS